MSTGADAMGVAAWLTPVLIVAVLAGLAHPAVGQPADSAPLAAADPAELIDPDCDPAEAEKADPLLVEEPDGVCPPEKPEPPAESKAPEPAPGGSSTSPDPGPGATDPAPDAAGGEPQLSPAPAPPPGAHGGKPAPDAVQPKRRPVERNSDAPARERRGRGPAEERRPAEDCRPAAEGRGTAAGSRRSSAEDCRSAEDRRSAGEGRRRSAEDRRRSARERSALAHARRSARRARIQARRARIQARRAQPLPLARFPRAALEAPEPLPPARRLHPGFAHRLERVSERFRVPWELMLAVRRARGHDGAVPASPKRLRVLARRLVRLGARRNARRAVRRLARAIAHRADPHRVRPIRRRALARRVVGLAHLNKAIGLRGLTRGLKRVKRRLARQVLESPRLVIYPGGRHDIGSGFTDVRVLVLLRYLSSRYREVTVSSLTTGHSFFTASGNVSNHSYGQAVDIAALNGRPILGNQEPGGLTERALHKILLLPGSLEPSELISLFELGGPSFALADHADHIHVGY